MICSTRRRGLAVWMFCVTACVPMLCAAAPRVSSITPRGLALGETTIVVVEGRDLLPDPRIESTLPIVKQAVRSGASAQRVEIAVTLAEDTPAGIYPIWIATRKGVSGSVVLGADRLPQLPFADKSETLPVAFTGKISGSQVLRTALAGKKGQRLVVDLEANRLGSKLKPVVRLYGPRGAQVSWSPPRDAIAGDARIETTLPSDGMYTVELHDKLYRAAGNTAFRLKIGQLQYADMVFPAAVEVGTTAHLRCVASNVAGEFPISVDAKSATGYQPAAIPTAHAFTGTQPPVLLSGHAEAVEAPADESGQIQLLPALPVGISGRIAKAGEEDRYLLPVTPGAKLRFEVFAARSGSALDGVLSIRRENGQQIAQNDDQKGTSDPGVSVTVPKGVDKLLVVLRDLRGAGGDDFVYRIAARDASQPDFSLQIDDDHVNVGAGATQLVEVRAQRAGYNGPIQVNVNGLPEGIVAAPCEIPAGDTVGLVALTASAGGASCSLVEFEGQGKVGEASLVRLAERAEDGVSRRQPWLRNPVAVARAQPAPVAIAWADTQGEQPMLLGGRMPVRVSVARPKNSKGKVRLRLVTSQIAPQKTVQQGRRRVTSQDVARSLRFDKAVELAAGAPEANAEIVVPDDLAEKTWSLAVVAELLAADNKTVLASSSTSVRQIAAKRGLKITLAGEKKIDARAGDGETGTFAGKVERLPEIDAPVTVTLTGLPAGYPAPKATIAPGQSDFELAVRFPANAKLAELKNVKLVATAAKAEQGAKTLARSNAVGVTVKVVAGE